MTTYETCRHYLGMDECFWESACGVLAWILEDQAAASILGKIKELLIDGSCVSEAAAECRLLKSHIAASGEADPDMTLAAVIIHLLPDTVDRMTAAGIPDAVITATLRDFLIWIRAYKKNTGRNGIWEVEWNLLFLSGRILRIGRLQYEKTVFQQPFYVYQNRKSGCMALLAADGVNIREDGRIQGNDTACGEKTYQTTFRIDGNVVTGNPVDTLAGTVSGSRVILNLKEHELLLAPGMPVLNIHIPEDGRLEPEAVEDSLKKAALFFAFGNVPAKVGVCLSWLMDPAIGQFTDEKSNIRCFMERFNKFPIQYESHAAIERIFGVPQTAFDIASLPEKTSLQAGLKRYLSAGGEVYDTGGIILFPS